MDVDSQSFPHQILAILTHISQADFVSFDLELSGIPSRLPRNAPRAAGRASLDTRYEEAKAAADKYQILQVGMTCAKFDYLMNRYVLRPYNITLSSLLDERLDIEREICFQSGAAAFLLQHNFDIGATFSKGVQYLSRQEAADAKRMAYHRLENKHVVQDVQLTDKDVQSLDFVRRAREAIDVWRANGVARSLDISTHTGLTGPPSVPVISRFEKRLVHQLVRADYPELRTLGRNECIRIIRNDPDNEAEHVRRVKHRVKGQIAKQSGFRWIFEALAGGDLDSLDPFHGGWVITADRTDVKDQFDRVRHRLKTHQPVLVGHNMFTDIVFFYRCFVGDLPETLHGFCKEIHNLFPRIIDTKYLATYAEGDLHSSPSLMEISDKLQDQEQPDIITHASHPKYHNTEPYHEAGFDSLLTATIMLRLSATLGAEHESQTSRTRSNSDQSFKTAAGDPLTLVTGHRVSNNTNDLVLEAESFQSPQHPLPKKTRREDSEGHEPAPSSQSRFQTRNIFDSLQELVSSSESEQELTLISPNEDQTTATLTTTDVASPGVSRSSSIRTKRRRSMEKIPSFDSDFWDCFGNTLRVFGTVEGSLGLGNWDRDLNTS